MAKGDLEVKRVKPKSNQSAPLVAAMVTALAASKPAVVVDKNRKTFRRHRKGRIRWLNRNGSSTMRIFAETTPSKVC